MRTSTLYTIGTALSRAQGTGVSVDVLVTGQWLHGRVSALDGHGLVLHGDDDVLSVLRMETISAVQVRQASAFEGRPEVEAHVPDPTVHPMPAASGATGSPGAGDAPDWARPEAARAAHRAKDRDVDPDAADRAWTGPVRERPDLDAGYAFGPGPSAIVVPSPRAAERPTLGPIVAPSAVPDAGLHTMLRSRRTVLEPSPVA
jgi:hypothetical protein